MGFGMGGQNGFTLEAGANKGQANSSGADTSYSNTHVTAGNVFHIESGGDTTLNGAVIAADKVTGNIGGNLNITSLQDTSTYQSKQTNEGFGISLCIPPLCYGMSTVAGGGVSGGRTKVDSTYQSVTEQSGIFTGDGGFNINVVGDTALKGATITTTDAGIAAGNNVFTHGGTITSTDIQNNAGYDANGIQIGFSYTAAPQNADGSPKLDPAGNPLTSKIGVSPGYGSDSGDASSVTVSGISGIAGNTAVRTGDAASGIAPIFDANRVTRDINAQITITQAALPAVTKAWADFANGQEDAAAPADKACWAEGGACRVTGHVFIGALGGGAAGAAGAGVTQVVVPEIGKVIATTDLPDTVKQLIVAGLGAAIGGAVGGTAGAVTGANATVNNYLTNWQQEQKSKDLGACDAKSGMDAFTCKAQVEVRYAGIDAAQGGALVAGVVAGAVLQTKDQVVAVVDLVKNLPETLLALKAIVQDPDFRAKVGNQVVADYERRIAVETSAYETGGVDGAYTAGVEAGRLAVDIVAAATAAVGASKVIAKVATTAGAAIVDATTTIAIKSAAVFSSLDAATQARWLTETATWRAATSELADLEAQAGGSAHPLLRHGDQVELGQLEIRARTGVTPDGVNGRIVDATRWLDNEDMLASITDSQARFARGDFGVGTQSNPVYQWSPGRVIGDGYKSNVATYGQATQAVVVLNARGLPITAYPKLP